MAKIEDRHRSFTVDGAPVATGVAAVADSWACTNPSLGRGATLGMLHGLALRDTVRGTGARATPAAFGAAWAEATDAAVEPWYRATLSFDRHRLAEIDAEIRGEAYRPEGDDWNIVQIHPLRGRSGPRLPPGRAARSRRWCGHPKRSSPTPALFEKALTLGAGWRDAPLLGPSRSELLSIVAA